MCNDKSVVLPKHSIIPMVPQLTVVTALMFRSSFFFPDLLGTSILNHTQFSQDLVQFKMAVPGRDGKKRLLGTSRDTPVSSP